MIEIRIKIVASYVKCPQYIHFNIGKMMLCSSLYDIGYYWTTYLGYSRFIDL